jgi:hypothetical protein
MIQNPRQGRLLSTPVVGLASFQVQVGADPCEHESPLAAHETAPSQKIPGAPSPRCVLRGCDASYPFLDSRLNWEGAHAIGHAPHSYTQAGSSPGAWGVCLSYVFLVSFLLSKSVGFCRF